MLCTKLWCIEEAFLFLLLFFVCIFEVKEENTTTAATRSLLDDAVTQKANITKKRKHVSNLKGKYPNTKAQPHNNRQKSSFYLGFIVYLTLSCSLSFSLPLSLYAYISPTDVLLKTSTVPVDLEVGRQSRQAHFSTGSVSVDASIVFILFWSLSSFFTSFFCVVLDLVEVYLCH